MNRLERSSNMKMEQVIRAIAGVFIIASITLAYFNSLYWLFLSVFVGINLLQSAFTKWCLMEDILVKMGMNRCS
jgi:hypothetical protein